MDLNNLKEELLSFCRNLYSSFINSSAVFFLKEKYDHLTPLYKRIIQVVGGVVLLTILLYYPTSLLYSSMVHIRDFKTKQGLLQELWVVSTSRSSGASSFYSPNRDMVSLVQQKIKAMRIPEKQIQKIQKVSRLVPAPKLPLSAKATVVEVSMEKLNLTEVVQYGHQMEQFSKNIKLMDIKIQEDAQKKHYFNVSYFLYIFNRSNLKSHKEIKL